jgi:hypothetical protein
MELMEMVKYFALAMALVGSLVVADLAQAGHRHHRRGGCQGGNCYAGPSNCSGGNCYAPVTGYAPVGGKQEYLPAAPVGPIQKGAAVAPAPAPVATVAPAPVAQSQYVSTPRRGLFGRRR